MNGQILIKYRIVYLANVFIIHDILLFYAKKSFFTTLFNGLIKCLIEQ